jgi:hypothetical protein
VATRLRRARAFRRRVSRELVVAGVEPILGFDVDLAFRAGRELVHEQRIAQQRGIHLRFGVGGTQRLVLAPHDSVVVREDAGQLQRDVDLVAARRQICRLPPFVPHHP